MARDRLTLSGRSRTTSACKCDHGRNHQSRRKGKKISLKHGFSPFSCELFLWDNAELSGHGQGIPVDPVGWVSTHPTQLSCVWYRKQTGLFLDLLDTLDRAYPALLFSHLTVVADNAKIHHARKVEQWLAAPPRFELLYLPTYCPRANPIERAFGDVHDKCTRNHTRKQMWQLVQDVKQHLAWNGPWTYALSHLYYTPEVTAAVEALQAAQTAPTVSSQLAA